MKRFSLRETLLMCAPVLALLSLPVAMKMLLRPTSNGIGVVKARLSPPSPNSVEKGADVAIHLKLDEMPDDNNGTLWKSGLRVVAGNHLLWDDKKGNGEREVSVAWRQFNGAWHEWHAAFDLDQVPAGWGEIALRWDAELVHTQKRWFRDYQEVSRRSGRIVLRRAGEKLAAPKVSRASRLKLLGVEIGAPKIIENGATSSYPIRLFFERDAVARKIAPRINCDYQVRPRDGFMTFSNSGGSEEITHWQIDSNPTKAGKARRFPIVEHHIDLDTKARFPGKSWVDWTIHHGDFWPMKVSIPFSDARGKVLRPTFKLNKN